MKCPLCTHRTKLSKKDRIPAYRELARHLIEAHHTLFHHDPQDESVRCPCGQKFVCRVGPGTRTEWFEQTGNVMSLEEKLAVHLMHVGNLLEHLVDGVMLQGL